ncbi:MAG: hypothetical protein A2428_07470 [Bdellovibrionales bacterium RIFOXYC1_FULL_54_43]|nr:MAG: hypothetical protein A2428_07470 [Bdellovibrionales bacterium RIFOXYC1_FULL_54_43]OFZ83781.1 MAG: hypothetical protein A2603_12665 [Bdellovibrionales bacterium RIFOXYD1_FULL_55_31]
MFLGFALLFLTTAYGAPAQLPPHERECLWGLAERRGTASCWVEWNSSKNTRVCLSRDLWIRWLKSPAAELICPASGRLKYFAYPNNHGHERHGSTETAHSEPVLRKPVITRLRVDRLADNTEVSDGSGRAISVWVPIWKTIEKTRERASEILAPHDPLGIFRHLLLSEKQSNGPGGLLRMLGFVHLLTATGIHLYALASWCDWGFKTIFCRFLLPRLSNPGFWLAVGLLLSRAAAFSCWLLAWLMSGGRPGMLRPWIVVMARKSAQVLGLRWRKWAPLAIALTADLLVAFFFRCLDGREWAPGRWIYALAVGGGLMTLETGSKRSESQFLVHCKLAIGSWVFVAIYEGLAENRVALGTPLLSVLTLPLFCMVLYPALLISTLGHTCHLGIVADPVLSMAAQFGTMAISFFFRLVAAFDSLWIIPFWTIPVAGFISALAILPALRGYRMKMIIILICFALRFSLSRTSNLAEKADSKLNQKTARSVEQLDVGEADAALVIGAFSDETGRDSVGLVDSGSERSLSDANWLTLFSRRGITRLFWVALTHLDEDHAGGLLRIQALLKIECVAMSKSDFESSRGIRLRKALSQSGIRVAEFDGSCFPFKTLQISARKTKAKRKNSSMSVMAIPLKNGGVYLATGDAGSRDEQQIVEWFRKLQMSRSVTSPLILKISHHGSRSATSEALLSALRPAEAWISAGFGNIYGHPSPVVLNRLKAAGARLSRTDQQGILKTPRERFRDVLGTK